MRSVGKSLYWKMATSPTQRCPQSTRPVIPRSKSHFRIRDFSPPKFHPPSPRKVYRERETCLLHNTGVVGRSPFSFSQEEAGKGSSTKREVEIKLLCLGFGV
ncbi:hypothetical protein Nepgr_006226 [Nepenthes gracilis]|uniref:Uncharacterized protein n=1 Tax=Nepenthes gracilis TaxID=150966 RepID=A0AAD3S4L1_NEPGR|nr:hypothetical protein Nepgr_006226 [Nepenthes gracilis]